MLRALGNERRLMILCKLVEWGEANVGALAEAVGLSQSALSQHLAKMREEGIVAFRRDSQTIWYRIDDPRTEQLLATLHRLFCRPLPKSKARSRPSASSTTEPSWWISGKATSMRASASPASAISRSRSSRRRTSRPIEGAP